MRKEIQDTITNRPEVETRDEERPLKVLLFLANRWITGVNKKQARGEFQHVRRRRRVVSADASVKMHP